MTSGVDGAPGAGHPAAVRADPERPGPERLTPVGAEVEPDPADAPEPPRRRGHRRVVRKGPEREAVAGLGADETPSAWADEAAGSGSSGDANDERLRRDVPPHW